MQVQRLKKQGQESVWDYPRPPRLERSAHPVRVVHGGIAIVTSSSALRILETSHPPTIYIPRTDVRMSYLEPAKGSSFCEWKGRAMYFDLVVEGSRVPRVAWSYPNPVAAYADLADHLAFYPSKVDACYLDEERVVAQEGDFYGGWITSNIKGPFKGGPGTWGW